MTDERHDQDFSTNDDERPADPDAESIFDRQNGDIFDDDRPVPEDMSDYVLDEPDDG